MKIPRVYKQLSGPRVLVMEWIDGIRCTNPKVTCLMWVFLMSSFSLFWELCFFFLMNCSIPNYFFIVTQAIKDAGIDVNGFLTVGVSAALRQLLEFGLFHGDPHPGNIFAMRDGRIAYVDFGNVAVLSQVCQSKSTFYHGCRLLKKIWKTWQTKQSMVRMKNSSLYGDAALLSGCRVNVSRIEV